MSEPEVLSKEEQLEAEAAYCRLNRQWLFEQHYYIKDKGGHVRPVGKAKIAQRKLQAIVEYQRARKQAVRVIVGKSRKQGITSWVAFDMTDRVLNLGIDGIEIAHDRPTAEDIFRIYGRYYDKLDLPKPTLFSGKVNKREMRFQPPHEGHIVVETAGNIQAGTGRTPQYIHATELPKWEHGSETATSLMQSIGDGPETTVIWESTFWGNDALFLPAWEAAYNNCKVRFTEDLKVKSIEVLNPAEWNNFIPLFISVLDDEEALLPFLDEEHWQRFEQTLDDYERSLCDRFDASLEYLNWRRKTLKEKCQNDPSKFAQEYPATPEEAVRASGRPRFNIARLDSMPVEDGEIGYLVQGEKWTRRVEFKPDAQEHLTRFRVPQPGHQYVMGIDTAEGKLDTHLKHPDASAAIVLDLDNNCEQVATYCGQISEENLREPLLLLAKYYNEAFVVIESNAGGKVVCVYFSEHYRPDRLYRRDDENPHDRSAGQREVGWKTHTGNRRVLVSHVADFVADGLPLHDSRTVKECKRFVWKEGGRPEAEEGFHDDHVFALGLAVIGVICCQNSSMFQASFKKSMVEKTQKFEKVGVNPICGY